MDGMPVGKPEERDDDANRTANGQSHGLQGMWKDIHILCGRTGVLSGAGLP
jgi:hypothetical protein